MNQMEAADLTVLYITGLSGSGTSTLLEELKREGMETVDLDEGFTEQVPMAGGGYEWLLIEEKVAALLAAERSTPLIMAGCCRNQGKFADQVDAVVLLRAKPDIMLKRVAERTTNPYGKTPEEREEILHNWEHVLPLLEKSADLIIDTDDLSPADVRSVILHTFLPSS